MEICMRTRFVSCARNHLLLTVGSLLVSSLALVSCAVDDTASIDIADEALFTTADNYFLIRADFRRCASPMCGGYFVSRPNRATTRCADGRSRAECYVASLDTSALGPDVDVAPLRTLLSTEGKVVVGGSVRAAPSHGFGVLRVTDAWVAGAARGVARGQAVAVGDSGIRCITSPCPSQVEIVLNSNGSSQQISNLDFGPSRATDDEIVAAFEGMAEPDSSILVFGSSYTYRQNGQRAKGRRVNQFFTRFAATPVVLTPEECETSGGEVRTDIGDGSTRCAATEEFLGRVSIGREGGVCCAAH
jgi:hypothetical protein